MALRHWRGWQRAQVFTPLFFFLVYPLLLRTVACFKIILLMLLLLQVRVLLLLTILLPLLLAANSKLLLLSTYHLIWDFGPNPSRVHLNRTSGPKHRGLGSGSGLIPTNTITSTITSTTTITITTAIPEFMHMRLNSGGNFKFYPVVRRRTLTSIALPMNDIDVLMLVLLLQPSLLAAFASVVTTPTTSTTTAITTVTKTTTDGISIFIVVVVVIVIIVTCIFGSRPFLIKIASWSVIATRPGNSTKRSHLCPRGCARNLASSLTPSAPLLTLRLRQLLLLSFLP